MVWRHGRLSRHKNFKFKNSLEKFSPRICVQDGIFQRVKLTMRSITHLCLCNWRAFGRKNAAVISPRRACSCTKMPRITDHLQPRRNWPIFTSNVLITHSIFRVWPRRTSICSLERKNKGKVAISRQNLRTLLPRRTGWTDKFLNYFFEWLAKVRARGSKVYWASWGVCW